MTVLCKRDTNNDGDCALCARIPAGCPAKGIEQSINHLLDRIAEARAAGSDVVAIFNTFRDCAKQYDALMPMVQLACTPEELGINPDPDLPVVTCPDCGASYAGLPPCPTCDTRPKDAMPPAGRKAPRLPYDTINNQRQRLAALKVQHPDVDLDTMATRYFGRGIEIGDSGIVRELTGLCGYTTRSDTASLLEWLETKLSD